MTTASHDGEHKNCSCGTDRRTFIQTGALATGALAFSRPAAAARPTPAPVANKKVTVVLFQRGGADALALIAPTGEPNYAVRRPTLAIAAPGQPGTVVGLYMDPLFSMHPNMPQLHARYQAAGSNVGIVHAAGFLPYDRSHFEAQDMFETGSMDNSLPDGWVNRHLMATQSSSDAPVRAIALRSSVPRVLQGPYPTYAVSSTSALTFQGRLPDVRPTLEGIVDTTPTFAMTAQRQLAYGSAVSTFDLIDLFSVLRPSTYVPANGAVYPNTGLGRALRESAEMIKARLGVEFIAVDQNGWDHHSALLANVATYATDFDNSINAFFTDLGARGIDVCVVVMTEFGREFPENGSAGTDHGVGGVMMVIGGRTRGGQMHGAWPGLNNNQLQDGRFLRPSNDFRNVLIEVLDRHMGGTAPDAVFPRHRYSPIGLF